jgi:hypothetical protein
MCALFSVVLPSVLFAREATEIDILSRSVPFHKLSQWLTYSLLDVIESILGWDVKGLYPRASRLISL